MRKRRVSVIPEALRRHNEEQQRDPEMVLQDVRWQVRVVVLWRQRDEDSEQWVYLERMRPEEFSYETVKQRWGGGAYRIRLFGSWDPSRRQEKYITQVAFWIWRGFPPTAPLRARLRDAATRASTPA